MALRQKVGDDEVQVSGSLEFEAWAVEQFRALRAHLAHKQIENYKRAERESLFRKRDSVQQQIAELKAQLYMLNRKIGEL